MRGDKAAQVLLRMAEWRVERIQQIEAVRVERADRLRQELGALRVALFFMNTPGELIPAQPFIPLALREVDV